MGTKKRNVLGQNFLVNGRAAVSLARRFNARKRDLILEIGPGYGALTKHLVKQDPYLCAVEKDERICNTLRIELQDRTNVWIINGDILQQRFLDFCSHAGLRKKKIRIIGNLPYSISKPILMKMISERSNIKDFMVMLQREVAEKILSEPCSKSYSPLSVLFHLTATLEKVMELSPRSFSPPPKVFSTVVRGNFLEDADFVPEEEAMVRKVISSLFARRRKTIKNNLALLLKDSNLAVDIIRACGLRHDMRAETLSPGDFVSIARLINMKGIAVLL